MKTNFLPGLDETKLRNMLNSGITGSSINEYGRFDDHKYTVDKKKAKEYFEKLEGTMNPLFKINFKTHNMLRRFIISSGFEM